MQRVSPFNGPTDRQKRSASALSACTVLLVLAGTLSACGRDDTESAESDNAGQSQASEQWVAADGASTPVLNDRGDPVCAVAPNEDAGDASWSANGKAPFDAIVLTQQTELPREFASLKEREKEFSGYTSYPLAVDEGLFQYQDRNIGVVTATPRSHESSFGPLDATVDLALVDADGQVKSHRTYGEDEVGELPTPFDLANDQLGGYYRIQASEGVEVPAQAMGVEGEQNFALSILPDVDGETLWVLLRGGTDLYKAEFYYNSTSEPIELNHANCTRYDDY